MINKRNLPVLLLLLGAAIFVAFRTWDLEVNLPLRSTKRSFAT